MPLRHGVGTVESDGQVGLALEAVVERPKQIDFADAIAVLKPLFEDEAVLKIGHNLKYDSHVLMRRHNGGISLGPVDDTMCLSYVLDAARSAAIRWIISPATGSTMTRSNMRMSAARAPRRSFRSIGPESALDYAAEDADITLRLWQMFRPRLAAEGVSSVYERLERPLIPVLASMENAGITVNPSILARMSNDFATRMEMLNREIVELAGEEFNVGSPKQLGEILFDKMGLEGGKKAKTGAYSTSADILETLAAEGVEIAAKVLDWRQLSKLKSTCRRAVESILPETGRVTLFSMVRRPDGCPLPTPTSRTSRSGPPRGGRSDGLRRRRGQEADLGRLFADRTPLVAHVAGEESMIEAFRAGVDIHARTASEVFRSAG